MAACIICGKAFETKRCDQVTCGDKECQRLLKLLRWKQKKDGGVRVPKVKNTNLKPKIDWSAIDKKCMEAHKTYGQMVAEGLL